MTRPASNIEWERWGETDPLFGVASWDGKAKGQDGAWTRAEFRDQGEQDWTDFASQWGRYDRNLGDSGDVALEIGCGAGRLTYWMGDTFATVIGVDISQAMLDEARLVMADGLADIDLRIGNGRDLPVDTATVDAVFSTHVFQHLDTKADAEDQWREAYRVLRPGGTVMVHLPIRVWPAGLERLEAVYRGKRWLGDLKARRARRRMVAGKGAPIMRGQSYDWDDLEVFLTGLGFEDVQLQVFRVTSNGGMHFTVLATKP